MTTVTRHSDRNRSCAATAWHRLYAELDAWTAAGDTATLWWRDDDAEAASPALTRLLSLQAKTAVPLAIAAVPQRLDPSLADALGACTGITVLQHGYSHDNFAGDGDRKIELGDSRPAEYVVADLAMGMQILSAMPGWLPVMVPPWNRIASYLVPMLPELGYRGLSALGARNRRQPVAGLVQNNVHLDPVDWRGPFGRSGGFVGEDVALDMLVSHLRDRREGRSDLGEASGLMTHHRVQSAEVWDFAERLIDTAGRHPAAKWCAAGDLFPA